MSTLGDIATAVTPIIGAALAGFIVTYGLKAYNLLASHVGFQQEVLSTQQQSAATNILQTAIDAAANGIHADVAAGKVKPTEASIKTEAMATLTTLKQNVNVTQALGVLGINPTNVAVTIANQTLSKLANSGTPVVSVPVVSTVSTVPKAT